MMCVFRVVLFSLILLSGLERSAASDESSHHSAHRLRSQKPSRRHRAAGNDGDLRFEPVPYSKKLELNSSGKIHCKVAGGVAPTAQWFLNEEDPLPEGVASMNGTLLVTEADRRHTGQYTCKATDGDHSITAKINLDIVVSPRVLVPAAGEQVHVPAGREVWLHCRAAGDPPPTTHWDRNLTILHHQQDDVDVEGGANSTTSRLVLFNNGTLLIRNATEQDSDKYGCTAGSLAGLDRHELLLYVHTETESSGVAGKAVLVSVSVAGAYMLLVLALMVYCRRRRLRRRQRGEKLELEMAEGREKLVEEGEGDKKVVQNGTSQNGASQNGRLMSIDKDSGADNSEVSGVSRASKKSGHYDLISRALLWDPMALGRGEFGDVMLANIDMTQYRRMRHRGSEARDEGDAEPDKRPVLVKALVATDETLLAEFRRQLELLGRLRHEHVARLMGLSSEAEPHYMVIEHTDWGDLKSFLIATRTPEENEEYTQRVGPAHSLSPPERPAQPLQPAHRAAISLQLASAGACIAAKRLTHRDIAARNCVITSQLQLKLSFPALTRGPNSHEYFKLHDQVIPLRWLPSEAVMDGEYSTKSDVYMFAATVWEIYTKAELPFAKLNDNSVVERLKAGSLSWTVPDSVPEKLARVLKRCWSMSPMERPQFTDVCEELTGVVQELTADGQSQQSLPSAAEE